MFKDLKIDAGYARNLLSRMIRINSVLPHEAELAALIADEIRAMGLQPELEEVAPGRPNVYATARLGGDKRFIVFSGHTDTVPPASDWDTDPFTPVERDGRLYGLGAINMKAGLACALTALRGLVEAASEHDRLGRVGFAATVDQEGLSSGARALLQTKYAKCDAMLHPEHFYGDSPQDYLPLAVTGKVLYKLTLRGRSAHAFRPDEGGVNAVVDGGRIVAALDRLRLREHPLFGRGTVCALRIRGGPAEYAMVVPASCELLITRLTVPGETRDLALEDMRMLVADLGIASEVTIEMIPPHYDPYRLDGNTPLMAPFKEAYRRHVGRDPCFAGHRGIVDANVFVAEGGIPTIVFGPRGGRHHMAGEYVDLATLEPVARVYAATVLNYFAL